jgi:alkylation response protein AidB-like acyl-CoA dehydrogenase
VGVCVLEEYGGAGADFSSYILVLKSLARRRRRRRHRCAHVGVPMPILQFGTEEQRAVRAAARAGEGSASAPTEPGSGSDAGAP